MTTGRQGHGRALGSAILAGLLVVALAGCSDGSADADRPTPSAPDDAPIEATEAAAPDCDPARPFASTTEPVSTTFDGQERQYLVTVPADYDGTTSTPLLFSFHGFGSSKEVQEINTSLASKGAERGFIVVTPDALGEPPEWNMFGSPDAADDFGFIGALSDELAQQLCVDPERIYAAGHSNGSAFTGFLVCKPPFRFAAVAMVAATIPSTCPDGEHPSVLAISGDSDPQVPYDGGSVGGGPTGIPPAIDTMAAYRQRYGCGPEVVVTEPVPGVRSERATGCADDSVVGFDTVIGGTHAWPGGAGAQIDPADSEAGRTWDASSAILDFFEQDGRR